MHNTPALLNPSDTSTSSLIKILALSLLQQQQSHLTGASTIKHDNNNANEKDSKVEIDDIILMFHINQKTYLQVKSTCYQMNLLTN